MIYKPNKEVRNTFRAFGHAPTLLFSFDITLGCRAFIALGVTARDQKSCNVAHFVGGAVCLDPRRARPVSHLAGEAVRGGRAIST